jgi:hypothetical protein
MSLADMQKKNTEDPLETAIKKGKPPTLKDVKMSVKVNKSWLSEIVLSFRIDFSRRLFSRH